MARLKALEALWVKGNNEYLQNEINFTEPD